MSTPSTAVPSTASMGWTPTSFETSPVAPPPTVSSDANLMNRVERLFSEIDGLRADLADFASRSNNPDPGPDDRHCI
eukprot:CAMPEP_0194547038 /NCGR_PEP_ID=MMETSP0253-20130528/91559_1 /TAXON_ID=2966 /ORGANISM="Noctiluca scintillans" /LENGTH=76 /DNA_ID=CAMNT_0039394205 /DNA_START=209 /DNA_END=439 /DNA_ORIENTATION=+